MSGTGNPLIIGVRLVDRINTTILVSFEGPNWYRDFVLVYQTYYNCIPVTWNMQVLRKVTGHWLDDDSLLATLPV